MMGSIYGEDLESYDGQGSIAQEEKIFVAVRLRPLNDKEIAKGDASDWECINYNTIVFKNNPSERSMYPKAYTFDRVYGGDSSTRQVYEEGVKRIALSVIDGINSSIFAYGQTSSGKTYTMSGITEYAISDIYDYISRKEDREFVLKFSAIEIYNECVRDLLSADGTPLRLLDDPEKGTVIEKLIEENLEDCSHLKELLSVCEAQRQIAETALNQMSSRSHQILRLTVESSAHEFKRADSASTLVATVNFVDLAGSERASQTLAAGTRLKEGAHINRSLLTLGTVIRKLSKGGTGHVPYRNSKLTRILQNSLGGNGRTTILCTMSPAHSHVEQSRNTLLFASCAKEVGTNAQVNVVMSDKALVQQLQRELARLENELKVTPSASKDSIIKDLEHQIEKMAKEMQEISRQRDLAESRLKELIKVHGIDKSSLPWEEPDHLSKKGSRDEYPASDTSKVVDTLRVDVPSKSNTLRLIQNLDEDQHFLEGISPRMFFNQYFIPDPCQGLENISQESTKNPEYRFKEDRHIEKTSSIDNNITDEEVPIDDGYDSPNQENQEDLENQEFQEDQEDQENQEYQEYKENQEDEKNQQHQEHQENQENQEHQEILKTIDYAEPYHADPFPYSSNPDLSESRITKEITMTDQSSPSSEKQVMNESMIDNVFDRDESNPKMENFIPERQQEHKQNIINLKLQMDHDSYDSLNKKDHEIQTNVDYVEPYQMDGSPCSFDSGASESRSMGFARSKSCYALTVTASPTSSGKKSTTESTINNLFDKEFSEGQVITKSKSEADVISLSRQDSETSVMSDDEKEIEQKIKSSPEEDVFGRSSTSKSLDERESFDPEVVSNEDMVKEEEQKTDELREVNEDNISSDKDWFTVFKKQIREIIKLWDECNTPLIHRMYFFLLFKGDPSDSVYIEVELRRLSFLKNKPYCATSARALNRERIMLSKKLQKKYSSIEREALFLKWGINLDSKHRRVQLSRLIWTKTNDIEHVKESAEIVAKLVGIIELNQTPKELFGLSLAPKPQNLRTSFWRASLSFT